MARINYKKCPICGNNYVEAKALYVRETHNDKRTWKRVGYILGQHFCKNEEEEGVIILDDYSGYKTFVLKA